MIVGPGVRPGTRIHSARTEDIGATLRELLGLPPNVAAEGRVLSEGLD